MHSLLILIDAFVSLDRECSSEVPEVKDVLW